MNDTNGHEALWRDTLLEVGSWRDEQPPAAAWRALRSRRRRRQAGSVAVASAALLALSFVVWWMVPAQTTTPVVVVEDGSPLPSIVRTGEAAPATLVQTTATATIVSTPPNLPQEFIVHSGPGRYTPLSDDSLLAMFGDRSPALIGPPGERHLVFLQGEERR